ncbi:hypothetical protein Cpir12675_003301 [Ceratocystis pirilliformis]|uniref:Cytochrome c oxidase assembly factor 3 n=1 Tax=Ceratocystis pirilliformis TaxID=259994 RepID=A0ABR3Z3Y3_9PEZI
MLRAYKRLSPNMRAALGLGVIAWGGIGMYVSDRIEERYEAPAEDKAVVEKYTPRVITIDRRQ